MHEYHEYRRTSASGTEYSGYESAPEPSRRTKAVSPPRYARPPLAVAPSKPEAPNFVQDLTNVDARQGESILLQIEVSGSPPPKVRQHLFAMCFNSIIIACLFIVTSVIFFDIGY